MLEGILEAIKEALEQARSMPEQAMIVFLGAGLILCVIISPLFMEE